MMYSNLAKFIHKCTLALYIVSYSAPIREICICSINHKSNITKRGTGFLLKYRNVKTVQEQNAESILLQNDFNAFVCIRGSSQV